jgi:serine/threonine protein kinase/WD40 repeat protein
LLLRERLAAAEREEVAAHLEGCPDCQQTLDHLSATTDTPLAAPAPAGPEPPEGFLSRLKQCYPRLGDTEPHAEAPPAGPPAWPDVPGYEVLGVLGRGGTAVVYKARQRGLNRLVALKVILAGEHATPAEQARFRAEAEAVARLQHPNIVQVYEIGEHRGLPFFSLEFCPGGSLAQRLDGTPLGPTGAAELVEVLARAVHHAHENGVVHRDLKPANVLLLLQTTEQKEHTEKGPEETLSSSVSSVCSVVSRIPKIADFGLARRLDATGRTATGAVMGTPSYMAPEQAQGRTRDVGPATDVYALGAILYELLAGRPPFRAAQPLDTMLLVVSQDPVPPRRFQPSLPRDLETVCLKCLQKETQKRYASARELADDLRRFLRSEPIRARRTGAFERAWRWCRRNPLAAALATSVGVLLLAAAVGASVAAVSLGRQRDAALNNQGRAERAERDATEKLLRATLARAQAVRQGGQMGQRFESLALLREVVGLTRSLDELNWSARELRNEVVGCLALTDVRVAREWPTPGGKDWWTNFDPALEHYAYADPEGGVRVLRTADDHEVAHVPGPGGAVRDMRLHLGPDGRFLAAIYWFHGRLPGFALWDLSDPGSPRRVDSAEPVEVCAFSPDGHVLAARQPDGSIALYDLARGGRRSLKSDRAARVMAFAPDGRRLALSGHVEEAMVQVVDLETGRVVQKLWHPDDVQAMTWSGDGRLLAVGADDRAIHVWDTAEWREQAVLEGHGKPPQGLTFSPDGGLLASFATDGTTRLWDPVSGRLLVTAPGACMHFSPDGRRLGFRTGPTMGVWEVADGRECRVLHHGRVGNRAAWPNWMGPEGIDFSPDGRLLVTTASDGVRLWEVPGGREVAYLNVGHHEAAFFHPDGARLYTFGRTGMRCWPIRPDDRGPGSLRVGPAELLGTPAVHGWFRGCRSADGRVIAAADHLTDDSDRIMVFSADRPAERTVLGEGLKVTTLAVSPDGRRVAAGLFGRPAGPHVWDAASGRLEWSGAILDNRVSFSPDGRWLVAGGGDEFRPYAIDSWQEGRLIRRERPEYVSGGLPFRPPDGRVVALAQNLQRVQLLDFDTRQEVVTLAAPDLPCVAWMTFSPDGGLLAMATESHSVLLWDLGAINRHLRKLGLGHNLLPETAAESAGPPVTRVRVFQEVHEAEHLRIVAAENCPSSVQDLKPWGRENWSNGKQLACAAREGGFVELEVDVPRSGRYRIDVRLTKAPGYGLVETSLDGRPVEPVFDGYNEALLPSFKVAFGTFELAEGPHRLRFTAVDKNPKSDNYWMGIDCVRLMPVNPPPAAAMKPD